MLTGIRLGALLASIAVPAVGFCDGAPFLRPVPKAIGYDLKITPVVPDISIEFTPLNVSFTLKVAVFGIVGDVPPSVPVDICPALPQPGVTSCYHINSAVPDHTYSGTITAVEPWASKSAVLRAVATTPGVGAPGQEFVPPVIVADATASFPVAARYQISMVSFRVMDTRSTSTDTDWITLQGLVTSTPPSASATSNACNLANFTWCVFRYRFGDANNDNNGVNPVSNVVVGPYDLTPEVEDDLRFVFNIDNTGDNPAQAIGEGVANGFSKVGEVILGAYGAASGSSTTSFASQLDGVMEQFHNAAFASCDGPVADDVVVLTNKTIADLPQNTLDALTKATGVYTTTIPKVYHNIDGDFRCDRRGSNYTVTYAVKRTSWVPWGNYYQY